MDSLEFTLNLAANIAEIIAGFAIVFSVIKVWPVFTNLNRIKNKPQDWKQQLEAIGEFPLVAVHAFLIQLRLEVTDSANF